MFILSFKLTTVPSGMTIDEAAFGYNAVLLSKTARDENGRKLPLFVLSIDGNDWRQPISQYYMTLFFKFFGPSFFNLRFSTVLVGGLSLLLMLFLGGISSMLLLFVTPIFFMHARLGLDNIMPLPFIISWLIFLSKFSSTKKDKYLILAGLAMGIGFYSYKGIRVFIPTWMITSLIYLFFEKKDIRSLSKYVFSFLPFLVVVPYLEKHYAGALLNNEKIKLDSVYTFFERYLSSFDPSFLFVKGDSMLFHSTGYHGMFLLVFLPILIIGIVNSWNKSNWYKFLTISLCLGPFLFGLFGSIHRASRMISEVPFVVLLTAFGLSYLKNKSKLIWLITILLMSFNFLDFTKYYFYKYPDATSNIFYSSSAGREYELLFNISKEKNLKPFVDNQISPKSFSTIDFFRSIYFLKKPDIYQDDYNNFPKDGLLMTNNPNINSMKRLEQSLNKMYFFVSK